MLPPALLASPAAGGGRKSRYTQHLIQCEAGSGGLHRPVHSLSPRAAPRIGQDTVQRSTHTKLSEGRKELEGLQTPGKNQAVVSYELG